MGTTSTRAARVGTAASVSLTSDALISLAQRPNLPPQQFFQNQVKIDGEIRLACASGRRVGAQHEQATTRKRGETPAHQFPEPSLHPVANHRRANRTADNKAYLRRVTGTYRSIGAGRMGAVREQQVPSDQRAASTAAGPQHAPEVFSAPHPRLLREHDTSCAARAAGAPGPSTGRPSATLPGSLVRRSAARGPCDGVRQERRGLRGYASAAGSHEPSPADGCSAGTYACSLELHKCNS
jgi:hypothetical protein